MVPASGSVVTEGKPRSVDSSRTPSGSRGTTLGRSTCSHAPHSWGANWRRSSKASRPMVQRAFRSCSGRTSSCPSGVRYRMASIPTGPKYPSRWRCSAARRVRSMADWKGFSILDFRFSIGLSEMGPSGMVGASTGSIRLPRYEPRSSVMRSARPMSLTSPVRGMSHWIPASAMRSSHGSSTTGPILHRFVSQDCACWDSVVPEPRSCSRPEVP